MGGVVPAKEENKVDNNENNIRHLDIDDITVDAEQHQGDEIADYHYGDHLHHIHMALPPKPAIGLVLFIRGSFALIGEGRSVIKYDRRILGMPACKEAERHFIG